MSSLPPAPTLPALPASTQTAMLADLFEPSDSLNTTILPLLSTPHSSYPALINQTIKPHLLSLRTTDPQLLLSILASHPRLGAPKIDSAQSAAEQAQLQGGEEVVAELARLNEAYEAKFPGLRFVVFVNGRGRGEIMGIMNERIEKDDWNAERDGAIEVSACCFLACYLFVNMYLSNPLFLDTHFCPLD
jgi:2-oxo-4-hydroxy-4-carboxy--5-ureidoimidazoline (OHCU) decarboxylase